MQHRTCRDAGSVTAGGALQDPIRELAAFPRPALWTAKPIWPVLLEQSRRCLLYTSYLMRTRLACAKDLLVHTALPISEVAFRAGFSDVNNFIRTCLLYTSRCVSETGR